jgi:hypothetical protein
MAWMNLKLRWEDQLHVFQECACFLRSLDGIKLIFVASSTAVHLAINMYFVRPLPCLGFKDVGLRRLLCFSLVF